MSEGRVPPNNLEAEDAVLGGILLSNPAINDVLERGVEAEDFYHPVHRAIFEAMVELDSKGQPIDTLTVASALKTQESGRRVVVGEGVLAELAARVPTSSNIGYYAKQVKEASSVRKIIAACGEIQAKAFSRPPDVPDFLDWTERRLGEAAENQTKRSFIPIKDIVGGVAQNIAARADNKNAVTGVTTGYADLDRFTAGLQPCDLILLAARPSQGKAQPIDALVKTVTGWKTMGDVCIGEEVASVDGSPSRVIGVYPQGKRQVYRVKFSDGRTAECCDEHLWEVNRRDWKEPRVVTLHEVRRLLCSSRNRRRLWVSTPSGDYGHTRALPLHPWALGALLGDGTICGGAVRFSTADVELLERLLHHCPGHEAHAAGGVDYRIVSAGGHKRRGIQGVVPNKIKEALKKLKLWGRDSYSKFIPSCYLTASRSRRAALLRGLLDTDGWVQDDGAIYLSTSSKELRDGVIELVRSLGGVASVCTKHPHFRYNGEKRLGKDSYQISIWFSDPSSCFTLSRKLERVKERERTRRVTFADIELSRVVETACIRVSHPRGLYITNDYVVTHNTALALNIVRNAALAGIPSLVFSLEMSKESCTERVVCIEGKIDSQGARTGRMEHNEWSELTRSTGAVSLMLIDIDDSSASTLMQIRAKSRRWLRQTKAKLKTENPGLSEEELKKLLKGLIVIDYLQLMGGVGNDERQESRERTVAEISMGLKNLAKELGLPVMALCQLNRELEKRGDKRPILSDLRESGGLEQDADVILFIYRLCKYEEDKKEDKTVEVIIGKQRNGPTGTVELIFLDHCGKFENKDHHEERYEY